MIMLLPRMTTKGNIMKMTRSTPMLRIDPDIKVSPLISPSRESALARKKRKAKNMTKLPIPSLVSGVIMTNWTIKRETPTRFRIRNSRPLERFSIFKIARMALRSRIKMKQFRIGNPFLRYQIVLEKSLCCETTSIPSWGAVKGSKVRSRKTIILPTHVTFSLVRSTNFMGDSLIFIYVGA